MKRKKVSFNFSVSQRTVVAGRNGETLKVFDSKGCLKKAPLKKPAPLLPRSERQRQQKLQQRAQAQQKIFIQNLTPQKMKQEVQRDYYQAFSPVNIQKMKQAIETLIQTPKRSQKAGLSSSMVLETPVKESQRRYSQNQSPLMGSPMTSSQTLPSTKLGSSMQGYQPQLQQMYKGLSELRYRG